MKRPCSLVLAVLFLPALLPARPTVAVESAAWRLESSHNGISLYTARVPGTGIVPVKAVMAIPGSLEQVAAVLDDLMHRPRWVSRLGATVLLQKVSDCEQVEYLRMAMPWPLSDRSAFVRVRVLGSADGRQATLFAESTEHPGRPDLPEGVRTEVYASSFKMLQMKDQVAVSSVVFVDPKGYLPQWVVNLFTSRVCRRTLEGLRSQVKERSFSRATLKALHLRVRACAGQPGPIGSMPGDQGHSAVTKSAFYFLGQPPQKFDRAQLSRPKSDVKDFVR